MIASVKEYLAVLTALLYLLPADAIAADDLAGAAREVARKTAGFVGKGETASIAWRNLSSLAPTDVTQLQTALENGLRDFGVRVADSGGAVEMRITVSENQSQYLVAAEVRKGEERQAFIAGWKRNGGSVGIPSGGAVTLERKLLWEQADPILDVALTDSGMLILSPSRVSLYARKDGSFEPVQSAAIAAQRPWPRDPRARLRLSGPAFRAFLPGTICNGSIEPGLVVECRPSEEPWTLDSGSRTVLLAGFATGRNHFDGHIVTQNGARKTVPAFFTAGAAGGYWLLTLMDGRTQVFDGNFDPAGVIPGWGSDLAATDARCGTGSQILATKAGDLREADSVRAYSIVNRAPVPLTAPVEFSGPVTALWTMNGASAVAVVRDLATGRYAAYLLTVVCGG
jgi:hypothetical protein